MWQAELKKNNVKTIYFNAWESDFCKEPLIPLIVELTNLTKITEKNKSYIENIKKYGKALVKAAIPTVVKLATVGVIDQDTISRFNEEIEDKIFTRYSEDKETIKKLREELQKYISNIETSENEKSPVVFFIDELDRCRPLYAIELLERIKHIFDIPGLVFVISIDKEQLGHSLRCIYGQGMNVDGYLRRFIDYDYFLPEPEKWKYCSVLFDRFGLTEYFKQRERTDKDTSEKVLAELFEMFDLTLREQEKCFGMLSMCCRMTHQDHKFMPVFLAFLITLKLVDEKLYIDFTTQKCGYEKVMEFIKKDNKHKKIENPRILLLIEANMLGGFGQNDEYREKIKEYKQKIDNITDEDEIKRLEEIINISADTSYNSRSSLVKYLARRINIAS